MSSNSLASSIVLACRPRLESAPLASRKDLLSNLQAELPGALSRLQQGNIAPVDLAQASIGPGMAVFSRYSKVIEADGKAMSVRTALGIINQVLDETLAQQEGNFDADTRWAVAWFEQFAMKLGDYGVAEALSKGNRGGAWWEGATSRAARVARRLGPGSGPKAYRLGGDATPNSCTRDWRRKCSCGVSRACRRSS
jgi:adenine-specific DNA methylase